MLTSTWEKINLANIVHMLQEGCQTQELFHFNKGHATESELVNYLLESSSHGTVDIQGEKITVDDEETVAQPGESP